MKYRKSWFLCLKKIASVCPSDVCVHLHVELTCMPMPGVYWQIVNRAVHLWGNHSGRMIIPGLIWATVKSHGTKWQTACEDVFILGGKAMPFVWSNLDQMGPCSSQSLAAAGVKCVWFFLTLTLLNQLVWLIDIYSTVSTRMLFLLLSPHRPSRSLPFAPGGRSLPHMSPNLYNNTLTIFPPCLFNLIPQTSNPAGHECVTTEGTTDPLFALCVSASGRVLMVLLC